jgi:hypothetical protein
VILATEDATTTTFPQHNFGKPRQVARHLEPPTKLWRLPAPADMV